MRITRLHHPVQLTCGKTTYLSTEASSHLIRVLRTKTNSDLVLFNGDGFDYRCKTLDENPKKTSVIIESRYQLTNESDLHITLIQGLSRQDRMETTIQKSVELGVNKIIPVICQRSQRRLAKDRKIKKLTHWKKVAISACEQSGRSIVPEITAIHSLENLTPQLDADAQKIYLNPLANSSLDDIDHTRKNIELFIGPEGGLHESENRFLQDKHFIDIRFGPRILRTETAGPAVICALQVLRGDI